MTDLIYLRQYTLFLSLLPIGNWRLDIFLNMLDLVNYGTLLLGVILRYIGNTTYSWVIVVFTGFLGKAKLKYHYNLALCL